MGNTKVIEFIQEVSRQLSFRLFWHIPKKDNMIYKAEVDAMEIAFELSISESLNADSSYVNQLPEMKELLNNTLQKIQSRRYRYEKAANELKDKLPILSIRQKYTKEQQKDADNLSHFRNIIAQFKLALEPNIKKAIKYIEKKLKEQEEKETVVVVEVAQQNGKNLSNTGAPFYRDVNYKKEVLGDIYVIVVKEGLLKDTGQQDFEYYFSGQGECPNKKLMKQDKITWAELIAFIKEIMLDKYAKHIWDTSEQVFAGAKQTTLRVTYNRYKETIDYGDFKKRLQKLLKDIPTK